MKYKTCHVIAITATFDPRLFLARMPGTSFQCILSWGFIQFSPLFSCDVISCFRPLLLPAGAGGRHGEHRHLPHLLLLPLWPDLARDHEPSPPQQQQQQVDFNQHRRVTSQWCDPQRIINKGRARGQFFPDLKIPAVSSLSLLLRLSGIHNQRLDVCDF